MFHTVRPFGIFGSGLIVGSSPLALSHGGKDFSLIPPMVGAGRATTSVLRNVIVNFQGPDGGKIVSTSGAHNLFDQGQRLQSGDCMKRSPRQEGQRDTEFGPDG